MTQHLPYQKAMPLSGTVFNKELSSVQGGRFELGFISAFTSSLALSYTTGKSNDPLAIMGIGAAIGGTAESLGGGKFSNGAVTRAFVALFNHGMHLEEDKDKSKPKEEVIEDKLKIMSIMERGRNARGDWRKLDFDFNVGSIPEQNGLNLTDWWYYNDISLFVGKEGSVNADFYFLPGNSPKNNHVVLIYPGGYSQNRGFNSGYQVYLQNRTGWDIGVINFGDNKVAYDKYVNFIKYRNP